MSSSFSGADDGGVPPDIICFRTKRCVFQPRFSTLWMTRPVLLLGSGFPVWNARLTTVNAKFLAAKRRFSLGRRFSFCKARFQSEKTQFRLEKPISSLLLEKCWRKNAVAG
jgi:hypothetical protein